MKMPTFFCLSFMFCGILAQASGEKAEEELPWGPEWDGVRIRLIPLAESYAVGKPLPFRLEMKNVSGEVVRYDNQSVGFNDSFEVKASGGEGVPYIGQPVQTTGGKRTLDPGKKVVLSERIDLLYDYLITRPDTYSIKFRGQGPAFGDVRFPASNVVELKVGEGGVSLARSLAENLIKVLPDDRWEASVDEGSVTLFCNRTGLKRDVLLLSIEFVEDDGDKKGHLLGVKGGRRVYLNNHSDDEAVEEAWEGFHGKIAAALALDPE